MRGDLAPNRAREDDALAGGCCPVRPPAPWLGLGPPVLAQIAWRRAWDGGFEAQQVPCPSGSCIHAFGRRVRSLAAASRRRARPHGGSRTAENHPYGRAAPRCFPKIGATGAALVFQRELLLPKLPAVFKDTSTIHGMAPARVSTSATNRASLHLVFMVANTAMVGFFNALKKTSRNVGQI
jgi:hypothetical protein